jgi:hypothetical protein
MPKWQELEELICDISESAFHGSWIVDTEYHVWRLMAEGGEWGRANAEGVGVELGKIAELSNRLGVWIVWDDEAGTGKPVDLNAWRQEYRSWQDNRRSLGR